MEYAEHASKCPKAPKLTPPPESVCAEADRIKETMKAECRKIVEDILIEEGCVCPKEEGKIIKHLPECPLLGGSEESVCEEADRIINGERRSDYGPVEESFVALAEAYSVVLRKKLKEPLTAHDAALLGVALKLVRESNAPKRDNRVDLCGYASLADKVAPK